MKTVAEYRDDLFVIAPEFLTEDTDELTRIDTLIEMAIEDYSSTLPKFDRVIVYAVAAQLRDNQLNAANSKGYSSVKAGTESVTYYSASGKEGNSYKIKLEELLGGAAVSARQFASHLGGITCP